MIAPATARRTVGAQLQATVQGTRPSRATRSTLSFHSINRCGSPNYDPGLQRHHLLPKQLLRKRYFGRMFESIGRVRVGFDDFRFNGLLLPATEQASMRTGLPLHRGPHPIYNELVIERVGSIESHWESVTRKDPESACNEALDRMRLLQRALRICLLNERKGFVLNRNDPLGTGFNFDTLDAMAEQFWSST
ncbi:AHH domain-containing protein [uncultured Erythrobacter sp.]|uniref:AHH domain-containing protein n=1 Tax=uncultured Erythrobacter sp. TaxID=263913 RepID=UPI0026255AD2|nr:AHH domain-containing protein [uncultured Erythrobacter sp.]